MTKQSAWKDFDAKLIARAWEDEDFKAILFSNPRQAVAQAGLTVPEGIEIKVVEQSSGDQVKEEPGVHYLVLPPKPKQDEAEELELSDEELSLAAGGLLGGDAPSATTNDNRSDCPSNYDTPACGGG